MKPPTGLPPQNAEILLRRCLGSGASTEYVLGDLREEYAELYTRRGRLRAGCWYWLQALRIGARVRFERRRDRRTALNRHPRSSTAGDLMGFELRQALRFLLRRPAFSGAILFTIALAIAATTVAFAVVDGVLIEPLPYEEPEDLVVVWEHNISRGRDRNVVSPANYITWRETARSFDELGVVVNMSATVTGQGEPERVGVVMASASMLHLIRATPLVGRLYSEEDDRVDAPRVVLLSEGYWKRRFAADESIVGKSIRISGEDVTVIGVLPQRFDFEPQISFSGTGSRDLWLAPRFGGNEEARTWSGRYLQVVGRLKPGVTVRNAQTEMTSLAARLRQDFPDRQAGWDINVMSLRDTVVGDVRMTLLIVFGAVCFVLLIACANVANLLLTRATARQQEMAVRAALGAGRSRLVHQLLLESLLLSIAGGVIGLAAAQLALRSLITAAPGIPRADTIGLDPSVIGFSFLATIAAALLFGLVPAVHISRTDLGNWLRERGTGSGRAGARRARGALVVVQVALSLMLLIGAGLLTRSMANRIATGVGFDTRNLLTAEVQLPDSRYQDWQAQSRFFEQWVEKVRELPGIEAASGITFAPLTGLGSATSFWPLDRPVPEPGQHPGGDIRWVHRDYFSLMQIPLIAGRVFDETDRTNTPLHVVINETGARTIWPGQSAVGKRLAMPWGDTLIAEVIGVVRDIRHEGPDQQPRTMLYWEHRQWRAFSNMSVIVRTQGDPSSVAAGIRGALRSLDAELPLYNVRTMRELFSGVIARSRFTTVALGLFAALALLLAAIGIYGVVSYATQQRAREIGIRMALGADRGAVVRLVVRQGLLLICIALVMGGTGALALSRFLEGLVFDISPRDPITFVGMSLLLGVVGLLASWLPARRASGIHPVDAIRSE